MPYDLHPFLISEDKKVQTPQNKSDRGLCFQAEAPGGTPLLF